MPGHFIVLVEVSDGIVSTIDFTSGVHSPPTPLIGAAPRPKPPPPLPRPPPGNPVCATAPRPPPPPLPRAPLPAGCVIAADPAATAAPMIPTAVTPNGDPGRRV